MGKMIARGILCPACGYRMEKGEIHTDAFRCPGCGQWLEPDRSIVLPGALVSMLCGVLVSYLAGLSGITFLLVALLISFLLACLVGFVTTLLRPRLVRRSPVYGKDFRITGPPDPPKNG